MKTNYLQWYKELQARLGAKTKASFLVSSAVSQPTDLLLTHLQEFSNRETARFQELSKGWGYAALAASIAQRYGVDQSCVATTNGVSNGIYLICRAILNERSHVIIESPVYEPLVAAPDFIGCRISYVRRRPPAYGIDPDEISHAATPHTKLVILSNLHNPSGAFLTDKMLTEIAQRARAVSPNVLIVVDEVYHDFVADHQRPAATLDDGFISLNSLTKVYGLGCLHCGWIIAPPNVVSRVTQLQLLVEGSYPSLLQSFSAYVLARLDEYLTHSKKIVKQNQPLVEDCAGRLIETGILAGDVPDRGCIYFPKVNTTDATDTFVEKLAEDFGVYVVPGRFFGESGHVRLGFGGSTPKLAESLHRFSEACFSLTAT